MRMEKDCRRHSPREMAICRYAGWMLVPTKTEENTHRLRGIMKKAQTVDRKDMVTLKATSPETGAAIIVKVITALLYSLIKPLFH